MRLDYGSGHEMTFVAWLGTLTRLGFGDEHQGEVESRTVNQDSSSKAGPAEASTSTSTISTVLKSDEARFPVQLNQRPSSTATSTSPSNPPLSPPTAFETALALEVFPLYLQVAWGLQDTYGLEPAGSHGVWGLVRTSCHLGCWHTFTPALDDKPPSYLCWLSQTFLSLPFSSCLRMTTTSCLMYLEQLNYEVGLQNLTSPRLSLLD